MKLRIQSDQQQHILTFTQHPHEITLATLQQAIADVTNIPAAQQQLSTLYPHRILQTQNDTVTLQQLNIKPNDTLKVTAVVQMSSSTSPAIPLTIHAIPNDNSCLFHAIHYCQHGHLDLPSSHHFRQTVASMILSQPDEYAGLLSMPVDRYVSYIQQSNSWGGAMEASILASVLQVEIAAIDVETLVMYKFGEDQHYPDRMYLIYSGIHYDALIDSNTGQRLFPRTDVHVEQRAMETARQAKQAGQYTNVVKFTLRCSLCRCALVGAVEASEHAKSNAGHTSFEEYTA